MFTLLVALLPVLIVYGAILIGLILFDRRPETSIGKTPNPAKAPVTFLGPVDVLTYAHPWFAGTILSWLIPGFAAMLVLAAMAAIIQATDSNSLLPSYGWIAGSLLLGAIFALPWVYAAFFLIVSSIAS